MASNSLQIAVEAPKKRNAARTGGGGMSVGSREGIIVTALQAGQPNQPSNRMVCNG